jgi:hypothetical protein
MVAHQLAGALEGIGTADIHGRRFLLCLVPQRDHRLMFVIIWVVGGDRGGEDVLVEVTSTK